MRVRKTIKQLCQNHIDKILKYVDTIVIGDGEYAMVEALHSSDRIIDSEKDKKLFLSRNYDEVAIPDRRFLDLSSYEYFIDGAKATNVISQMGCPYQCEFCSGRGSKTFSMVRKRSVGNILEEIDSLYHYMVIGDLCSTMMNLMSIRNISGNYYWD